MGYKRLSVIHISNQLVKTINKSHADTVIIRQLISDGTMVMLVLPGAPDITHLRKVLLKPPRAEIQAECMNSIICMFIES